ncbi:MAG: hypothetical protein OES69_04375 [Myxococcales bacterium]|nr:hypothetical protein [Myxococcales bacterium]
MNVFPQPVFAPDDPPSPAPAPADPAPAPADPAPADPAPADPASASDPASAADPSLLGDPDPAPAAPAVPQTWPEDWRQQMAGDDEKVMRQLERTKSPADLAKRLIDTQAKLAESVKPLTVDADSSDEEVAAYREAVGIPDDIADYDVKFSENTQPTEQDNTLLGSFRERAHAENVPPAQAQKMLDWYEEITEAAAQDRAENASTFRAETTVSLKEEWGGEYASNLNAVKTYLESQMSEEARADLVQKPFADGTYLGDNPHFLRMMASIATDQLGPNAIFAGDVHKVSGDLEARKNELLALRGSKDKDERAKYKSDEVQKELSTIYDKLGRIKARA